MLNRMLKWGNALMRDDKGAVSVNQIMGIIFAVILVVVGLVMLPLVLDQ